MRGLRRGLKRFSEEERDEEKAPLPKASGMGLTTAKANVQRKPPPLWQPYRLMRR